VPEQDRSRLFLFVLGVIAVHALCLAAVLPALFTLPGQGVGIAQGSIKQDAIVRDTIVNVEVMPSSEPTEVPESRDLLNPSPGASLASTPDSSDVTSTLPDSSDNTDTAPGDTVTPAPAPITAAAPSTDLVGDASPTAPPAGDAGTLAAADPAPTSAVPKDEAATTVSLPTEKPKPAVKSRTIAAKTAKPHIQRQASVTRTQSRGMFGGFFQSQPRPKTQRTTTTAR
jgi:hypothetical protein